jgi:hypothetical protein
MGYSKNLDILASSDGYELAVKNATAIPANTPGILSVGSDGTNARYIAVDASGRQIVSPTRPSSSTLSQIAISLTSVSLLASNTNRLSAIFYNNSNQDCFLAFSVTASATAFTVKIPKNGGSYEINQPCYTGTISGIWTSTGSGALQVTELS